MAGRRQEAGAALRRLQERALRGTMRVVRELGPAAFLLQEDGRRGPPLRVGGLGGVWGHTHGSVRVWGEAAMAAAGRCPCRCCSERRTRAAAAPPGRERGSASTSAGEGARPEGRVGDGTGGQK